MKKSTIVTLSIVGIIVILIIYIWGSYNGLVSMKETATAQWQQVETQYQRRLDLIPSLVESVKGTMKQEIAVFTAIADARTHYAGATTVNDKVAAASQVESAVARLLVVMENYPTLKSIDAVQGFMTQLEGTANRITVERERYNNEVKTYEVAIKKFPGAIVASIFGFTDMEYFQAASGSEVAPSFTL